MVSLVRQKNELGQQHYYLRIVKKDSGDKVLEWRKGSEGQRK